MYGANYALRYMAELQEMYDAGAKGPRQRRNAAMMLRVLKERYPGVFALPSEAHIKQAISKMREQEKRGPSKTNGRYRPSLEHKNFIQVLSSIHIFS